MSALNLWKGYRRAVTSVSLQASSVGLVLGFIFTFYTIAFVGIFAVLTELHDFRNWTRYEIASQVNKGNFSLRRDSMDLNFANGETATFSISGASENPVLLASKSEVESAGFWAAILAVPIGGGVGYFASVFLVAYQRKQSDADFIRGGKFADDKALAEAIIRQQENSDLMLGTVPMLRNLENRHMGFFGDTGTGKSQLLFRIVEWAKGRNDKGFIVDKTGEFTQHFFDPEKDYILSPFDDRSLGWSPYNEGTELYDFERIAKSFIPLVGNGDKNDHWPEASVTVWSWLLYGLHERGLTTIDQLVETLSQATEKVEEDLLGNEQIVKLRGINEILGGTMADIVVDPSSPEHAGSVLASLIPKVRSLWYLRGLEKRSQFSFREWAADDSNKGWVFIRVTDEQLDSVNPVVTAWIDTLIKSVLSLPKSSQRAIWGFVDELQSFEKINSLKKSVYEGRKHGLRMALGCASVSELHDIYGEKSIKGIMSMLATKLIYRTSEPDTAEWASKLLLEEDVMAEQQGMSFGTNDNLNASDKRERNALVTPSEIMTLPDLTAYLRFGGDWPTTKTTMTYKEWPEISVPFIPRKQPPLKTKKDEPVKTQDDNTPPPFSDEDMAGNWDDGLDPLI